MRTEAVVGMEAASDSALRDFSISKVLDGKVAKFSGGGGEARDELFILVIPSPLQIFVGAGWEYRKGCIYSSVHERREEQTMKLRGRGTIINLYRYPRAAES